MHTKMNFAPAGEVSIVSPDTTPAGYGGIQIRWELEMAGVKSSYVHGQRLESRHALEASAFCLLIPRAKHMLRTWREVRNACVTYVACDAPAGLYLLQQLSNY